MGMNLKWDSLEHYTSRQANIFAHCFLCNRTATFDSSELAAHFRERGWGMGMVIVYQKLKCSRCKTPAGKVGPTRRLADTHPPKSRRSNGNV